MSSMPAFDDEVDPRIKDALRSVLREHLEAMGKVTELLHRSVTADHDLLIRIQGDVASLLEKLEFHQTTQKEINEDHENRIRELEVGKSTAKGAIWATGVLASVISALISYIAAKVIK